MSSDSDQTSVRKRNIWDQGPWRIEDHLSNADNGFSTMNVDSFPWFTRYPAKWILSVVQNKVVGEYQKHGDMYVQFYDFVKNEVTRQDCFDCSQF